MRLVLHLRLLCPPGTPRSSSFVCEQKMLPQAEPGREILEQAVNLGGRPTAAHLPAAGVQLGEGKGGTCWLLGGFFSSF